MTKQGLADLGPEALTLLTTAHSTAFLALESHTVPESAGIYAWWTTAAPGDGPIAGAFEREGRCLLYVGIAPRAPSADGVRSTRTLRQRLIDHRRGPIARSTLRRSLVSLLGDELGIVVSRDTGKVRLLGDGEGRLSNWMSAHLAVSWVAISDPWRVEEEILRSSLAPPLNIAGVDSEFSRVLSQKRRA